MPIKRRWDDLLTIETAAFTVLALYCVWQHLYTYNYTVGKIPFTPRVSGSYVYIAYMVAAAFLPHLTLGQQSRQVINELILVAVFFSLAFLVIFLCADQVNWSHDFMGRDIKQTNLAVITGHILAFAVGFSLKNIVRFKLIIIAGFSLLAVNTLINIDPSTMLINLNVKEGIDENNWGIYLMLGDTFGLWALLTCAVTETKWRRVVVVAFAVVCLTVLKSRTSLYTFLVAIPFVFRKKEARAAVIIGVTAAVIVFISSLFGDAEGIYDRMYGSLVTGRDISTQGRITQFDAGLQGIADHWLLGDYAGQVRDFGDIGAYIHNILSYWQQFGLLPFSLLLILWWRASQRARLCYLNDETWVDPDVRFYVLAVVFSGIEALTSRSYFYPMQWLLLGQSAAQLGRQPWVTLHIRAHRKRHGRIKCFGSL